MEPDVEVKKEPEPQPETKAEKPKLPLTWDNVQEAVVAEGQYLSYSRFDRIHLPTSCESAICWEFMQLQVQLNQPIDCSVVLSLAYVSHGPDMILIVSSHRSLFAFHGFRMPPPSGPG